MILNNYFYMQLFIGFLSTGSNFGACQGSNNIAAGIVMAEGSDKAQAVVIKSPGFSAKRSYLNQI
ncbi:hypothetical protein [Rheinheimera oceanensis]|uniref:hypothetical protein n=1 Tax=Rheinheimera oceanensis TaxID=2817449 RepID=UPI001BFE73BF|nr:hypothetical protein [Rheinheimera oceanensis]